MPGQQERILPVSNYRSEASRVEGFRKLKKYGLRSPEPMHIIGDKGFRYWREFGLDDEMRQEIEEIFDEIKTINPDRGVFIGRAFYVPEIDNPNGPRTGPINDKDEFVKEIEGFWQFVTDWEYDQKEGSDIALVLHPFIDSTIERTKYGQKEIEPGKIPWSGGYVVPVNRPGMERLVCVVATFGPDEAVVSCPHDRYLVDPEREIVFKKRVDLKTKTFVPVSGNKYQEEKIPTEWQCEQALTDVELIEIAKETRKVFDKKPARVEFITQPDGVYYREIAEWDYEDDMDLVRLKPGESVTGEVIVIESSEDVKKIKGSEAIVFFSPKAFQERTTDLFSQVSSLPGWERLIALVHGSGLTSHMAKILWEAGHDVEFVGDRWFSDKDAVEIKRREDGEVEVNFVNRYHKAVVRFDWIEHLQRGEAGNKVKRLAEMKQGGFPVPNGFGVVSRAIWQHLGEIGVYEKIQDLDTLDLKSEKDLIASACEFVQNRIMNNMLPESMVQQITEVVEMLDGDEFAVRSSGSEDGEQQSLAGLYESVVQLKSEEIEPAIRRVIASYFSKDSIQAVRQIGFQPSRLKVGVGVHEFVPNPPGTLGVVVFGKQPIYQNKMVIEMRLGSPEKLVQGVAKDKLTVLIDRSTGDVSQELSGDKEIEIKPIVLRNLVELIQSVEAYFRAYQDMEILILPNDEIKIVQARPM